MIRQELRIFVLDMLISPLDVAFIHFMAALCHHVNINVCLEGVECDEKFDCLRLMGLVSWRGKPVPQDVFE